MPILFPDFKLRPFPFSWKFKDAFFFFDLVAMKEWISLWRNLQCDRKRGLGRFKAFIPSEKLGFFGIPSRASISSFFRITCRVFRFSPEVPKCGHRRAFYRLLCNLLGHGLFHKSPRFSLRTPRGFKLKSNLSLTGTGISSLVYVVWKEGKTKCSHSKKERFIDKNARWWVCVRRIVLVGLKYSNGNPPSCLFAYHRSIR